MSYSQGHVIRLVGGRLALDFVNTADWTPGGQVAHEKLSTDACLDVWLNALKMGHIRPDQDLATLLMFRTKLRQWLLLAGTDAENGAAQAFESAKHILSVTSKNIPSLDALLAMSALSVLSDAREWQRLKICPGDTCGWLFLDETKNARRTWCSMQSCGNRAKAARHYAKVRAAKA